jgi:N6-adenosine-specific RNA methylase IME4
MKKPKRGKAQRAPKKTAKRTGPSQRTAAERKAIDKRAAAHSKNAKREQRAAARRKPSPLVVGITDGLQPLGPKLAQLVAETTGTIQIGRVKIGKRHRKNFGDLKTLAQSINDRGGLLQPIAITSGCELIAGERRMRAWQLSRFAGLPIPCHVIDVDAIVRGEWDENAERKDFEPSEAIKIKRTLESVMRKLAATRPAAERAAPGRKASGAGAGEARDKVARLTGYGRETLRKIEAVVEAAEQNPQLFGDLQAEMDRSGKVNTAHKKLTVRKARRAIETAPPPMPMNAKECGTWSIDFPWAAEMDREQASIDAADRAFRPYPEMSIKSVCKFAAEQLAPNLPDVVSVWLWVPNYVLVRGYHSHVIAALGFKPDHASTLLTWDKVELGRGQLLREQTEHAILLRRGRPLVDVFGENPPTTLIREARRENSRKPDAFYRLAERVTPATRYAAIFSQGGEGGLWDGHGDQVGKFAPDAARAAEAELIAETAAPAIARVEPEVLAAASAQAPDMPTAELVNLELIADGHAIRAELVVGLRKAGLATGRKEVRLTKAGLARLSELRQAVDAAAVAAYAAAGPPAPVEPAQIDLEQAIAAKSVPGDPGEMPAFLRRTRAAEGEAHAGNT